MSEGFSGYIDPKQDTANNYIDLTSCAVCLPMSPDFRQEMAENYSEEVGLFAQSISEAAQMMQEPSIEAFSFNPYASNSGCF